MRTHPAYSTARRSRCPTWPIPGSRSLSRLFARSSPSAARSRPPRAGRRLQCGRLRRQSGAASAASERRSSGPRLPDETRGGRTGRARFPFRAGSPNTSGPPHHLVTRSRADHRMWVCSDLIHMCLDHFVINCAEGKASSPAADTPSSSVLDSDCPLPCEQDSACEQCPKADNEQDVEPVVSLHAEEACPCQVGTSAQEDQTHHRRQPPVPPCENSACKRTERNR